MTNLEFFMLTAICILLCIIASVCNSISEKVNNISYLLETATIIQVPDENEARGETGTKEIKEKEIDRS